MKSIHQSLDKELLALDRERRSLWKQADQKIPLDEPIQRGWTRCHCLTREAENRPDAALLAAILKRINVVRYHWRRTFAPTKRNQRSQRHRLQQALLTIPTWEWHSSKTPEEWKPYFSREFVWNDDRWSEVFRFRHARLFEMRILPNMIYELPICDPKVDSRLAEIESKLSVAGRSRRLDRLLGLKYWRSPDCRFKKREALAKKRMRAAIQGDLEAEKATFESCLLRLQRPICKFERRGVSAAPYRVQ